MAKTVYTNQQVIGQINSGAKWLGSPLTYSFLQSSPSWDIGYEGDGFSAFTSYQANATRSVMSLWGDLIAPSIVEQTSNQQYANVTFGNTTTGIGYAHAYYPGNYSWAGEVWLNAQTYNGLYSPDPGDYYFMTILHEAGHALGLSHPGAYNGGSPTYANDAEYAQDTHQWTVMSYFSASNTGADWDGGGGWQYAQTPMVHDILTIQAIYGVNQSTRTGDTTYGFNSNAGNALFDFSQNWAPVLTIYDSGGIDTLDLSGFSQRAIINLEPGTYSSAGGVGSSMTYNIGIAHNTWIENAIGGSGNDTIYGNALDNILLGGGGNDFLYGYAGNDTLAGGSGTDWAGFSFNFVDYAFSFLQNSIQVIGEGVDSVADDTEWFQFADFNISYNNLTTYFQEVEIEANGDYKLVSKGGQYYIEDVSQNLIGLSESGVAVGPNSYAGFSAIQAEEDGAGGFKVLWSNTSGGNGLWQIDSTGNFQSYAPVDQAGLIGLENTFEFDLNGDGAMGFAPVTVETNGNFNLIVQGGQYFIQDASQNLIGLNYSGVAVGPNSYAGYSAIQAEEDGAGGFNVLWSNTSGGNGLWQIDSTGSFQSYSPVDQAGLIGLENTFEYDLNSDGTIGPITSILAANGAGQNTLSGTDGADTFALANLDIADLITDYNFLEGDDIDLTALFTTDLNNDDGGADDKQLSDFVQAVENGSDTSLEVDITGSGDNFAQIATLQGITTGDLINITFNDDDGGASLGNIIV